jgi:hypothetical protein
MQLLKILYGLTNRKEVSATEKLERWNSGMVGLRKPIIPTFQYSIFTFA